MVPYVALTVVETVRLFGAEAEALPAGPATLMGAPRPILFARAAVTVPRKERSLTNSRKHFTGCTRPSPRLVVTGSTGRGAERTARLHSPRPSFGARSCIR